MNRQGRPTEPLAALSTAPETFTGNRALRIEEALIFEIGRPGVTGRVAGRRSRAGGPGGSRLLRRAVVAPVQKPNHR